MSQVTMIATGVANVASVRAAFERLSVEVVETTDPSVVRRASRVVLPGVGSFGAGVEALDAYGLRVPLVERVRSGQPLLAVCLGLQLLCDTSEETRGATGLGLVAGHVRRFPATVRTPQMGWNDVVPLPDARCLAAGCAYYANSFRLEAVPEGWSGALSTYPTPFVAALERGPVLACQFHPELSGAWGRALIARWLEASSC